MSDMFVGMEGNLRSRWMSSENVATKKDQTGVEVNKVSFACEIVQDSFILRDEMMVAECTLCLQFKP